MKYLVDAHLLLWAAGERGLLSAEARSLFADPGQAFVFSAASIWEVAIKQGLGVRIFRPTPACSGAGSWTTATWNLQ